MGGLYIEEDMAVKYSIVSPDSPEGLKIHHFLLERAKLLADHVIDFEKNPVTFVMSDSEEPNAFFAPAFDGGDKPRRDEYKNIRYIKNTLGGPVICVTKGLIGIVDNIDQLDYVLGHELTHLIIRKYGVASNSKGEETIADLHSVDLMCDAGADPKQALQMDKKFAEYQERKEEEGEERRYNPDVEEHGINWSEILDVHATSTNRRSALEAALTRHSHLIDDRTPTTIDKSVFSIEYGDPVMDFLRMNNYGGKKQLGKLKLLIDCIEHLATQKTPDTFYRKKVQELQEQIDGLSDSENSFDLKWQKERLEVEAREGGYKNYFHGKAIEKKYQQEIAALAEGIIEKSGSERERNGKKNKPAIVNALDLKVYLLDKAYQHILQNGYPVVQSLVT